MFCFIFLRGHARFSAKLTKFQKSLDKSAFLVYDIHVNKIRKRNNGVSDVQNYPQNEKTVLVCLSETSLFFDFQGGFSNGK